MEVMCQNEKDENNRMKIGEQQSFGGLCQNLNDENKINVKGINMKKTDFGFSYDDYHQQR